MNIFSGAGSGVQVDPGDKVQGNNQGKTSLFFWKESQ